MPKIIFKQLKCFIYGNRTKHIELDYHKEVRLVLTQSHRTNLIVDGITYTNVIASSVEIKSKQRINERKEEKKNND